jgi:hypothetical protein
MKYKHNFLKFKELISETTEEGRYYYTPDGRKYPSVTTVVGYQKSKKFENWRKMNPNMANYYSGRGENFHSVIESHLLNEEYSGDKYLSVTMLFNQIKPLLERINNIKALEIPLWSDTLRLAGRVDCVADYDGVLSIIDFKTSTREKSKIDIEEYFLQTTAYSLMMEERYDLNIDKLVIVMSCDDGGVLEFIERPIRWLKKLNQSIKYYRDHVE